MAVEDNVTWRGVHVSQLQTSLNRYQYPPLISDEKHTVLVNTPIISGQIPECLPSIFNKKDYWDRYHVKLPCSEKNVTKEQINRWHVMRDAFSSSMLSSHQLEAAILNYNKRYAKQWNFSALHSFFEETLDEAETSVFFVSLLPKIVELALCLPELVTGGIPLLRRGRKHSVSLSQLQISCLLSNAFLCAFPHRNSTKNNSEYFDYPDVNFNRLFQCKDSSRIKCVHEKLKCILNYFRRVTTTVPTGVVTYSRQFVPSHLYPQWSNSNKKLPRLFVSSSGTIEDDGFGLFQVDFANKFVGGGVLGRGCVQEEIRFVICPELILSRLFTQCLDENEALVVTGCERFNKYKGYGHTFEWDGDYIDGTPVDEYGRKYCTVIAVDALYYQGNPVKQYSPENLLRDLNKAYVGFSWGTNRKKEELCAVATGNWGCGVFRGDPQLKSLLQLMAAAEADRDLAYFTFGDVQLRDSMASIHRFLVEKEITIGKINQLLSLYNAERMYNTLKLFDYLRDQLSVSVGSVVSPKEENDPCSSKMFNASVSTELAITQRAFCFRMKPSGSIPDRLKSPKKVVAAENGCHIDTTLGKENHLRLAEARALSDLYRIPGVTPAEDEGGDGDSGENGSKPFPSSTEKGAAIFGSFDVLEKFKNSLRCKRKISNTERANIHFPVAANISSGDGGYSGCVGTIGYCGNCPELVKTNIAVVCDAASGEHLPITPVRADDDDHLCIPCLESASDNNKNEQQLRRVDSCKLSEEDIIKDGLRLGEEERVAESLDTSSLLENIRHRFPNGSDSDCTNSSITHQGFHVNKIDDELHDSLTAGEQKKYVGICRTGKQNDLKNNASTVAVAIDCAHGANTNVRSATEKFLPSRKLNSLAQLAGTCNRLSTGKQNCYSQKRKISDYFSPRHKKSFTES